MKIWHFYHSEKPLEVRKYSQFPTKWLHAKSTLTPCSLREKILKWPIQKNEWTRRVIDSKHMFHLLSASYRKHVQSLECIENSLVGLHIIQ